MPQSPHPDTGQGFTTVLAEVPALAKSLLPVQHVGGSSEGLHQILTESAGRDAR